MAESTHNPEYLAIGESPVDVGRSSDSQLWLYHPNVSRRHATLVRRAQGVLVQDHDSKYGTLVNGHRVRSVVAHPGDRIQFGTAIVYRVEQDGLRLDTSRGGVSVAIRGVSLRAAHRVLLADATLSFRSDSLWGILGPSGAGKTTLLNCLAGYTTPSSGRLLFDGDRNAAVDKDGYRSLLAHVPQHDVLYPELTVRETMDFAARLRFHAETTTGDKEEAILGGLAAVGLTDHVGKRVRVISGGQRKRLAVAVELLRRPRPRLLLLDEPTSGLDPASDASLMSQMCEISRQGTTLICTTHTLESIHLFDGLVLIGSQQGAGRIAYVGEPEGILPHFQCRHYADVFERLEAGRFAPVEAQSDFQDQPTGDCDFSNRIVLTEPRHDSAQRPAGPPSSTRGIPIRLRELVHETISQDAIRQFSTVLGRAFLLLGRDRGRCVTMLVQPLLLALLASVTQFAAWKAATVCFLAVVIAMWLGMNNSVGELVRDRRHYVRERLAGLRPTPYLLAKASIFLAVGVVQIVLLLAAIKLSCSWTMQRQAGRDGIAALGWAWPTFVLCLAYAGGLGLGLLTSALARTEEQAIAVLPLLIMPQLLLSALGTAQINDKYTDDRAFKPIVAQCASVERHGRTGWCVDRVSLLCASRPAALLLEQPEIDGCSRWAVCLADLCHLVILTLGTWLLTFLGFFYREQRWPGLIVRW